MLVDVFALQIYIYIIYVSSTAVMHDEKHHPMLFGLAISIEHDDGLFFFYL